MIKEILGVPVFDVSKRLYLGQYLGHIVSFVNGKEVWQMSLGIYNLYCKDKNDRVRPLIVNGLPTPYFDLLRRGMLQIKGFYQQKIELEKLGISSDNILNLDYVLTGRDAVLLVDLQDVLNDVEFIRKLDVYASLKEITKTHEEKIKALKLVAKDYKELFELTRREKELIETQLMRYKTFYQNIKLAMIEMETELDKLRTIIQRLSSQVDIQQDIKDRLEVIISNLRRQISLIKSVEEKMEKELESEKEIKK